MSLASAKRAMRHDRAGLPEDFTGRRILIADDDPSIREWLAHFAKERGFEVEAVSSGEQAMAAFRMRPPDLVAIDLGLPGLGGLATLKAMREIDARVPIVMVSGQGPTQTIVEAVRLGATDFLRLPLEPDELEGAFRKALGSQGRRPFGSVVPSRDADHSWKEAEVLFRGASERMRAIARVIDRVADTDITVLIRGESGTGKELVARALYERSSRRDRTFVKVNCAALPEALLESELFGYERGAFTGAERRKLGKFEIADGGTIFLDEISEMPPSLQAKLLQVLQDGQFARLGGDRDVSVDVRIVAATNRNLEEAVREGVFREDLFYRLNVVSVELPPLRERREEIPWLVEKFLRRYSQEYRRPYTPMSETLAAILGAYSWPGNVRELENLMKRLVVLGDEAPVLHELESRAVRVAPAEPLLPTELENFLAGRTDRVNLKRVGREAAQAAEKRVIQRVLERTRWNRREAAEILQISYKALLYKIRDSGLADPV